MNKNIAFIYSRYYPLGGGVANAAKNFAEALHKDGNEVTVYTIIPWRSKLPKEDSVKGVNVIRFKIPAILFKIISLRNPNLNILYTSYWVGLKIFKKKKKHDLIFGHNIQWGGNYASTIGKMNKIPSAGMAHGEDVNQLVDNLDKEKMTGRALENLDYVFSTNQDFTNVLNNYKKRKFLSLPNIFHEYKNIPLDNHIIEKRFNNGSLNLVCIGRLDVFGKNNIEIKGFSIVLEAMRRLPNSINLEIIGDGPLMQDYKTYIRTHDLCDRVNLKGMIPFEEVQAALNNCSLVLLPSNIEGLSMVMLETMSKGIPLVASNIAGAKDYIDDRINGLLIEPGDVDKLVEQVEAVARNFNFYTNLSFASKKTFEENFTEKAVVNKLYKHLDW